MVAIMVILGACSGPDAHRASLLVVGDSVAAQSAQALMHLAPDGVAVTVDAVQPGTAPCDWVHGFTVPGGRSFPGFATIIDATRPDVVVFVFTGNPGLSGPSAGCVDANGPYDVEQLMSSYEPPLRDMADQAVRAGATAYFEAPPPRNPAVPVGFDAQQGINQGFQGSPDMVAFYRDLVADAPTHRWRYDERAALAVSTPGLEWELTLPCQPWDAKVCQHGQVPVRVGGDDAVHLDKRGCGAIRFALAIVETAFGRNAAPAPDTVADASAQYGGCQ